MPAVPRAACSLALFLGVYCFGGCIYNRVFHGAKDMEQVHNVSFWISCCEAASNGPSSFCALFSPRPKAGSIAMAGMGGETQREAAAVLSVCRRARVCWCAGARLRRRRGNARHRATAALARCVRLAAKLHADWRVLGAGCMARVRVRVRTRAGVGAFAHPR